MGAVLKGRDNDLGRDLAVKVLLERHGDDPDLLRRFVEEAQIAGQLQHPGIVPVYELGTFADRRPYFAMKLVKGRTLAEVLAEPSRPDGRPPPAPGDLPRHRPDDGVCPRPGGDPPRPEAVQRDGGLVRRGPGDGLGPGQGPAPGRGGRRPLRPARWTSTRRSSPRPGAARSRISTSRTPGRCWARRLTWRPSRPGARTTGWTSGPTSSRWARSSARSSPASPPSPAGPRARSSARRPGATSPRRGLGSTAAAPTRSWSPWPATPWPPRPTTGLATPGRSSTGSRCISPGVQEKLRAAELAHAAESARAEEAKRTAEAAEARALAEGRARRLTLALAASIVGLFAVGGGGYAWDQRQKAERSARTARAVDEALADAARLRGEARSRPWARRAAGARPWPRRVGPMTWPGRVTPPTRSSGGSPSMTAGIADEQVDAEARAGQAQADRDLLARLEAVRGDRSEHNDAKRTDAEYAEAFRRGRARPRRGRPGRGRPVDRRPVGPGRAARLSRRLGLYPTDEQGARAGLAAAGRGSPRRRSRRVAELAPRTDRRARPATSRDLATAGRRR